MERFIRDNRIITAENFNDIANLFLNRTLLLVDDIIYGFCEIEFYLNNKDHDDQYVHCSQDQKQYGKYYFHKHKNGVYKNGTFKGMDITLGNNESYCGVLVRSIYNFRENKMICGPCNVVNEILRVYDMDNLNKLCNNNESLDVLNNKWRLHIRDNMAKNEEIYHGPRIGLSDKYEKYKNKRYRYCIMIKLIKKDKKQLIKVNDIIENNFNKCKDVTEFVMNNDMKILCNGEHINGTVNDVIEFMKDDKNYDLVKK